jgi:S1-C subfamily serine protease
VEADLEASGNNFEFQINPMPTKLGQRQAIVSIKSGDAFKQEATVRVGNMTRDAQGKPAFDPPLIEDEKISLKDPWEKSFRIPVPNVRNRDAYILRLGSLGDSAVVVSRLRVSGTPLPSVGLSLAEKDGVVYADKVMPKSLADKARFQVGDVIAAIAEKEPKSVNEAMDLLGDLPLDEASEITVKRGDEKRTFTVTPTFGK